MILAEKTTASGSIMRLVLGMDDGVVEFLTIHQGVIVNFGAKQSEAWAWFNAVVGADE